ncbi:hypothetical protein AB0M36_13200 [Actinoplanes sp. NPDC051346]
MGSHTIPAATLTSAAMTASAINLAVAALNSADPSPWPSPMAAVPAQVP